MKSLSQLAAVEVDLVRKQEVEDSVWDFDSEQYRVACEHLGLHVRSESLREKVAQYLSYAKDRAPAASGFGLYLAWIRPTPFKLGLLDVWTRLCAPRHPWRYKLNAVIAIHECDTRGYEDLRGLHNSAVESWFSVFRLGVQYLLMVAVAFCWMGGLYVVYATGRKPG